MITRLTTLAAALPAFVLSISGLRAADTWETDFEKAKATAAKESRDLLMDFTGSDWCSWCIRLHQEVFDKDAFKQEAPKHFVLLELDFPQQKELPAELAKQNDRLKAEYMIESFPSIVLADAQGRPYASTGYEPGGAEKYMASLTKLRKIREARDAGLKKAAAAEGVEKAKFILEALRDMDSQIVQMFYQRETAEAIAADKEDVSGAKREFEFPLRVEKMEEELAELHDQKKFAAFTARVDKFITDEKLTGSRKQELLMAKLGVCENDLPAALKILDEVIAVDPKSEMAEHAEGIQESIRKMQKQEAEENKGGKKGQAEAPEKEAGKVEKEQK